MNPMKILKAAVCRLTHTGSWEKRGKSMKDNISWSGRKTYSYWCPECSDLRITGKRILPKGNS